MQKKSVLILFLLGMVLIFGAALDVFAQPSTPQAATYYVSSSQGDDDNDGLSESAPFATIHKVNGLDLDPGDQVLFKCGDTWQAQQLVISKSGSESAPITFRSYPADCENKPVLSGSLPVTGWSLSSGQIYEAALPSGDLHQGVNQLFRDGERLTLGRWPNLDDGEGGYSFVDEHAADGKEISDNELPGGIDWTGAMLHLKNMRGSMINREVTASSDITLTLNKKFTCVISNLGDCVGWGYFLNNHYATLDQGGEWYYDATAQKVYLVSTAGPPQNIEASVVFDKFEPVRHGGVMLSDGAETAYVVLDNLEVKNWFNHGIDTPESVTADIYHHITLRNLSIKDVDAVGIRLKSQVDDPSDGREGLRGGHHLIFENNRIDGANHFGITGYFAESTLDGNQIQNIGLIENLGKSGMGCGLAADECPDYGDGLRIEVDDVRVSGFGNLLRNNRFEKIGNNAVDVFGPQNTLERNFITQACDAKADCGGVRVYGSANLEETDVYDVHLIDNIIVDIPGNVDGCHESLTTFGMGIYIDYNARDVEVRRNTVISTTVTGILVQRSTGVIQDNTVYNASTGTDYSAQLSLVSDITPAVAAVRGNILYGLNEQAWTLYASSLNNFVSSNYNYLFQPYVDQHIAFGPTWTLFTLSEWRAYSGLEGGSKTNWFTLDPSDPPLSRIIYNDTQGAKTFDLGDHRYLDLDQDQVIGAVTLLPFASQILIDDGEAGLTLSGISPSIWLVDEAANFILNLTGAGFTTDSVVRWNGANRPTTFLSSNRLTAEISAADVSTVATILVTVYEPGANPPETQPLAFRVVEFPWSVYLPLMGK